MQQFTLFQPPVLSVTELTRYLRGLLEGDSTLQDTWVQGEVSNFARPSSGHLYFTLKDASAALKCVIWRTAAQRIRFGMQDGMAVEVHGAISIYEPGGQYQLYVDAVRSVGEGRLYQEFLRLKARLEAEGCFDESRKRLLPTVPKRIGIVTSPTGAALQDMLNTLRVRYPLVEVILSPTAVQGEEAPLQIIRALERLDRLIQPDVIIVARGGGSLEDLWCFNDERVVRAIASCATPVVTGIGHETDTTLADYAADYRAPTPTGAAVAATPDRLELIQACDHLADRLDAGMQNRLAGERERARLIAARLRQASPLWRIQNARQLLDNLIERTNRSVSYGLALRRARVDGSTSRLQALNPTLILQRGYALVTLPGGEIVRTTLQVKPGIQVQVHLAEGGFDAMVAQVRPQIDTD
ncbi:MAG TPA: exodeoxyribonuclease VII large subunit [Anaerolineaceae bacterium]